MKIKLYSILLSLLHISAVKRREYSRGRELRSIKRYYRYYIRLVNIVVNIVVSIILIE